MFVMESSRGLGVGRALMQAALAHARASPGVLLLSLTVTHGNEPAVRLYEGFGFKAFGTEPLAILTPSGYRAKIHMWLELTEPGSA